MEKDHLGTYIQTKEISKTVHTLLRIKHMSHTMKLWERVIECRLREKIGILYNQFRFMPGWSTIENIYLLQGLAKRLPT